MPGPANSAKRPCRQREASRPSHASFCKLTSCGLALGLAYKALRILEDVLVEDPELRELGPTCAHKAPASKENILHAVLGRGPGNGPSQGAVPFRLFYGDKTAVCLRKLGASSDVCMLWCVKDGKSGMPQNSLQTLTGLQRTCAHTHTHLSLRSHADSGQRLCPKTSKLRRPFVEGSARRCRVRFG